MANKPCLTCGRPTSPGPRCPRHTPQRGSTAERGYGAAHQRRRKKLLPLAIGTDCPICGQVMLENQGLDLDHSIPLAQGGLIGDRIVHSKCNRGRKAA